MTSRLLVFALSIQYAAWHHRHAMQTHVVKYGRTHTHDTHPRARTLKSLHTCLHRTAMQPPPTCHAETPHPYAVLATSTEPSPSRHQAAMHITSHAEIKLASQDALHCTLTHKTMHPRRPSVNHSIICLS
jgi:hypothetical protein